MSADASATPAVHHHNTTPAASSYNWALSSAVAATSAAASAYATTSDTALHPAAVVTSIMYVQPTSSGDPASSQSSQPYSDAAVAGAHVHGLIWAIAGMMVVGGLVVWP